MNEIKEFRKEIKKMTNQNNNHIIIAPHPDDEIIGCFDILNNPKNNIIVIYTEEIDKKRKDEAANLRNIFETVKVQLYLNQIPQHLFDDKPIIHYPDPIFETHPIHRLQGNIGEQLLRYMDLKVVFYSTNMTAPYIYENENSEYKKLALDKVYPSQKKLWKYDHKYFLFEGHCMWLNQSNWIAKKIKTEKDIPNEVESEIILTSSGGNINES